MSSLETIRHRLSKLDFPYDKGLRKIQNKEAIPISWDLYEIRTNGRDHQVPALEEDDGGSISDSSLDTTLTQSPPRTSHVENIKVWLESMNKSPPLKYTKTSPQIPETPQVTQESQFQETLYSKINWARLQMNSKLQHDLFIDCHILEITNGKFVNFNCYYPPKQPGDLDEMFALLMQYTDNDCLKVGAVLYYILKDYGSEIGRIIDTLDITDDLRRLMDTIYFYDRFSLSKSLQQIRQTTFNLDPAKLLRYATVIPFCPSWKKIDTNDCIKIIQSESQHLASLGLLETMKVLNTNELPESLHRTLADALVDQFPEPPDFWSLVKHHHIESQKIVSSIFDKTLAQKIAFSRLKAQGRPITPELHEDIWQIFSIQKLLGTNAKDYPYEEIMKTLRILEANKRYASLSQEVRELVGLSSEFSFLRI
ncbi:unnamed protein product [Kuraishia capsulata CBS 1993]|uniref:ELYS-like domain-containing protein n=1 Tax=Kuraishia capsulata CBS 1993 TaxID=1382522 RepID=W6MFB2_9ASCO|nr:uncharacterized protein KUCA_T00000146001 [Kuraishia capsulata CBS 1993]CDK24186.1 unnamed protein product [Kuraishia capsulata CBS 1993]